LPELFAAAAAVSFLCLNNFIRSSMRATCALSFSTSLFDLSKMLVELHPEPGRHPVYLGNIQKSVKRLPSAIAYPL